MGANARTAHGPAQQTVNKYVTLTLMSHLFRKDWAKIIITCNSLKSIAADRKHSSDGLIDCGIAMGT
ncbi:hypothetical protein [Sphingobacterium deserti]|uniref:hypothetical protein n=1 Tax=Sphingobacterium deserti TaxID=1229276 RepID=UPI000569F124|nr:hypothetical protein [Sphingobacterium deserti]